MANKSINELPAGTQPVDSDLFVMDQNVPILPTTYKVTALQYSAYINLKIAGKFLPITGGTLTGPLFVPAVSPLASDPPPTQVVPYEKVQQQASYNGTKKFVIYASTVPLIATYANGPDSLNPGIGATLTNAGILGPLILDGFDVADLYRVLIKDQTSLEQNGIYDVVNPGSFAENWVLVRSPDFDGSPDGQIGPGALGLVLGGATQFLQMFVLTSDPPANVGTDAIIFEIASGGSGPAPITNAGFATLINGTVNVSYPAMDNFSFVLGDVQTVSGPQGHLSFPTVAGVGFTINSTSNTENSVVGWSVIRTIAPPPIQGFVTLSAGNATVSNSGIRSDSVIILTIRSPVNSPGRIVVTSTTSATSFSISSGYAFDTSVINYAIYNSGSSQANGIVTLSSGSASVSLPGLGVGDIILLTIQSPSATNGDISVGVATAGVGFTIISNYGIDTSVVGWVVYPAASLVPHGTSILSAGTSLIAQPAVQSSSIILVSSQNPSSTFGNFSIGTVSPSSSFVVNSNYGFDVSQIGYVILN